jgi:1-acyl-sn-glycerol-3-phosphate acyltransferase
MTVGNRAAHARNIGSLLARSLYRVHISGAHNVPNSGPTLLVSGSADVGALLMLKAMSPSPVSVLLPGPLGDLAGDVAGDISVESPYAIGAQIRALGILSGSDMFEPGCVLASPEIVDCGFLILEANPAVIPIEIWCETRDGETYEWISRAPAPRSQVHVYFGEPARAPEFSVHGRVNEARSASEWCRQFTADHHEMVLHRLGRKATP